jgi:hypothetical protein
MKHAWVLALLIVPYSALVPQSPGNPNGDAYVGQPGSTYDASANPAKTVGTVTYNPYAPLPANQTGVLAPPPAATTLPR